MATSAGRSSLSLRAAQRSHVAPDLLDQGLAAREALLVANLPHELHLERLAVEVVVDAGDVDLEQRARGFGLGERGASPDVGDGGEALAAQRDDDLVDARGREDLAADVEVGRRESERAAAAVAAHDGPEERMRAAEQVLRRAKVAGLERRADARGGDRLAVHGDRGGLEHLETEARRERRDRARGAEAVAAEVRVVAEEESADPDPRHEHALDEAVVGRVARRFVEGKDDGRVDAEPLEE